MIPLAVADDKVTPGVLGFLVFAALAVATWLLLRSMGKQLRRIDFLEEPLPGEPAAPVPAADEQPAGQQPPPADPIPDSVRGEQGAQGEHRAQGAPGATGTGSDRD